MQETADKRFHSEFSVCVTCQLPKALYNFRTTETGLTAECRQCIQSGEVETLRRQYREATELDCTYCKRFLPKDQFKKMPQIGRGYDYKCKRCAALQMRERAVKPSVRYSIARTNARQRQIEWSIPLEEYTNLLALMCHYCGLCIPTNGTGLDRKDPEIGYTIDNVVPCCNFCNWVKGGFFTELEMAQIGEVIRRIRQTRVDAGLADEPLKKQGRKRKYV